MATNLSGKFTASMNLNYEDQDSGDLTTPSESLTVSKKQNITNGTGDSQGDSLWNSAGTLSSGGTTSFDFKGGSIVDAFGTTINWAEVRMLYVFNGDAANGATLKVSGNLIDNITGVSSSQFLIPPQSWVYLTFLEDGAVPVDAGSGDSITLTHQADQSGDIDYEIALVGATS